MRVIVDAVGLGAVILSLVFVGTEIRQNTAAVRSATQQAIYEGAQEANINMMANERLREVLLTAGADPDWLSSHAGTPDYLLLQFFFINRFNYIENVRFHLGEGTFSTEAWVGVDGWFRSVAREPLMEHFWLELQGGYMDDARNYVDSVFASRRGR
jgi:hypothetical protein